MRPQVDDLQDMAGKYADTVEENRRLYNEVQDLKGNIRVFCRIRPPGTTGDQHPSCLDTGVDGEVPTFCAFHMLKLRLVPRAEQIALHSALLPSNV